MQASKEIIQVLFLIKKEIFNPPSSCSLLPVPQNVSFPYKFMHSFMSRNVVITLSKTNNSNWTNTALVLLFCFVPHVEVGIRPHQGTRAGHPGSPVPSGQPLSQFQWDECSSLPVTPLRGGHISEMCEVIPVLARHLREPRADRHISVCNKKEEAFPQVFLLKTTEIKFHCYPGFGFGKQGLPRVSMTMCDSVS